MFDELTALTELALEGNPGAPFSPSAVALPDDAVVSAAGGTVELDGSGSKGGPWGANVTYSWSETSGPTSGVTFDDAASATTVVTIPALTAGTELEFTLTVTGRATHTDTTLGTAPATDTARVTVFDPAAGICGRTEQVRDAILGKISGVTDCALVTDAHLAAIAGTMDLDAKAITALAAGDFDGLTSLEELGLHNNSLSSLPAEVFDELTALTILNLNGNDLASLDDGVFTGLTALTTLDLAGNPGAPFSPEAVARSDDETVPDTGGMVRLDGSGSNGGPWGTNVTYGWALTAPASGVSVTFDDDTSVTPQVTVPALPADTEQLTFTLTVTGRGGTSGIAPATATVTVTVTEDLRPYVTLASPNAYHLETLGLHANEATGRPVTLVVLFSAEVTGLEAEEFVIENGEVTDVYWTNCLLRNPSRVRWCIVMQPDDAPGCADDAHDSGKHCRWWQPAGAGRVLRRPQGNCSHGHLHHRCRRTGQPGFSCTTDL